MTRSICAFVICMISGSALGQTNDAYTSAWASKINSLDRILETEKRVIDSNISTFRTQNGQSSFVFHGLPNNKDAILVDQLLKQQHIDLWAQNSDAIQQASQDLKNAANQIQTMSATDAIQTLDKMVVSDNVKQLFSTGLTGNPLPDPPHFRTAQDRPSTLGGYVLGPGSSATIDYPAVADVMYNFEGSGYSNFCTGTLISTKEVLTAAHCFCDLFTKELTYAGCVKAKYQRGAESLAATNTKYVSVFFQDIGAVEAQSVNINPDYIFPKADIAIIELSKPITTIEPAPIINNPKLIKGTIAFVVGYGLHSAVDAAGRAKPRESLPLQTSAGLKMWARVALANCAGDTKNRNLICWTYLLSQGQQALGSTCEGDSGGPVLAKTDGLWSLVGVTSGGRLDCAPSANIADESWAVDASKYLIWIKANASLVQVPSDDKFIVNRVDRVFNGTYHEFVLTPDKWNVDFVVPPNLPSLSFAVNSTLTSSFLQINLVAPDPNKPGCMRRTNDSYVTCGLEAPLEGTWRLEVSGSRPQETQVVGVTIR
jgi:hypothetical protein